MHQLAPLIYDLAIMLGLAGIVILIFQRIHQPVVLGYLVAGMIVGPYTPPHALVNDIQNIKILSELGVIFLMFSLGLEFSFQKLTRVGFSASVTGLIEVVLMVIIGYVVGQLMGWTRYDSLFLGAALSISSTTIIIKAIEDLGLKAKRFAELIFGVLIVEDLLAILLLVALSTIVLTKNIFSIDMLTAAIKLILVVGGWFIIGYFIVPPLFRRIAKYISEETLTIISVALCLSLVCAAANFHYSTALGAFIMGSILAETVLVHRIENLIRPIRDIFAAVFFISVGMLINPIVIIAHWQAVLIISLVTIFGKIITTSIAAILTGQSLNTSVRVGFSMAQVGEFSFIIAALGLTLNVTNDSLYPIIVAVSGVTTFTTPYLIRLSGYIGTNLEKHLPVRTKYFLQSYSAWVYRTQTSTQKYHLLRSVSLRLFINGMIVAIIFALVHELIYPKFLLLLSGSWLVSMLCLLIAVVLASPFIWGMLFSYRSIKLPEYAKTQINPAISMVWFITLAELAILSIIYFHTWMTVFLFIIVAAIFFAISFQQIEKSYHWFERQLVKNIKHGVSEESLRYEELAPWDTHLVEIEVSDKSALIGKTLRAAEIRQKYGVNIVAICHGSRVIAAPRGDEQVMQHDKLIVLGNDEQIDAFKQKVEKRVKDERPKSFLGNFTLKAYLIERDNELVGKTIRDSQIRERVNGMIVGIERDNERILNPSSDTILQIDDLILMVGEINKLEHFNLK